MELFYRQSGALSCFFNNLEKFHHVYLFILMIYRALSTDKDILFFSISKYPLYFELVIFKVIAIKGKYLTHVRTRSIPGIPLVVDPLIGVVLDLNW